MKIFKTIASFAFAAGVFLSSSVFADTVKIAFIDPLSGPFATTGTGGLAQWKFAVEKLVNEKGRDGNWQAQEQAQVGGASRLKMPCV